MMENTLKTLEMTQEQADMDEVNRLLSEGQRITAPALQRRLRERSDRISRETFERYGMLDIAVNLIRDVRDEA